MIEIIKKKYKKNSTIIIYTENDSFKGKIIEFSDNYIEIETENTTEFLSIKNIVRFSIPKEQDSEQNKKQKEEIIPQSNNKSTENTDTFLNEKLENTNETKAYKVGDVIP